MTERRKPAERRREIADAALKIVAERGLGRLTSAEIAREVGVTDAAIFHHFRSKEEIVLAAIDRVGELLFDELPPDRGDPLQRLGEFFRQRVGALRRCPGAGRLVLSDLLAQIAPPTGVAKVRAYKKRSVEFVRSCLQAAEGGGMLAESVALPEATVLVVGSLMALTQARELVASQGSGEDLALTVWQTIERILRRPAVAPASAASHRAEPGHGALSKTDLRSQAFAPSLSRRSHK